MLATETAQKLVRLIDETAARRGLSNVHARLTELGDPDLPDPPDTVAMFNLHTFCDEDETRDYFEELHEAMKADGRVVFFSDAERTTRPELTCQLDAVEMADAVAPLFDVVDLRWYAGDCPPSPATPLGYLLVLQRR